MKNEQDNAQSMQVFEISKRCAHGRVAWGVGRNFGIGPHHNLTLMSTL